MNYIQYMKPGGNFGNKLKGGLKKFLKATAEASRMIKDSRINNPGAAMIRDAYSKGDNELAKQLTDEMQAANLTGIMIGSGAGPLATGLATAPVTTVATLATGMVGGGAGAYVIDKAINYSSDGQYTGWGDWVNKATNGAIGENTSGFFHPGAILGGLVTGKVGNKIVGATNRGKLELLNSALNKQIKNTKLSNKRIVEKNSDYLYHQEWPRKADGIKRRGETVQVGKQLHSAVPRENDYLWWDKGMKTYPAAPIVRVKKQSSLDIHPLTQDAPGIKHTYLNDNYYVTPAQSTNIDDMITFRQQPDGSMAPYSTNRILNNKMSIDEMFQQPIINDLSNRNQVPPKTSLAFFERQPAKVSEAERLGISKGDRGNLSRFQKEALEDLTTYRNKWIRQKYPQLDNNGNIIWSNGTNKSFLDTYVAPLRGDQYKGVQLYPHIEDDGSYLMRMSMGSDDLNGGFAGYDGISAITLTSPKMNAINQEIPIPIEQASPTLPKEGVKTFWAALQDVAQPGSYISGDFGGRPLGYNLIRQYNKIGTPIVSTTNTGVRAIIGRNGYQNVINELFRKIPWKSHYDGLSTDSYMALLKQGNRPGYKLRFSKDGFTNWNHQSFENKYIQDLYEQALIDPTKQQEFLKVFHDWVAPYGGHNAVIKNGKIIIPQPFIVRQKSGGSIKSKNKNKGKFAKVRDYVDYKNNK